MTGVSLDQTAYPNAYQSLLVASLNEVGHSGFGGPRHAEQAFEYSRYDFSYPFLAVPGGASVVFEVGLEITYGFGFGGDLADQITADFSNDAAGYEILCQEVDFEIFTAPGFGPQVEHVVQVGR
jgi:hypothetical protein